MAHLPSTAAIVTCTQPRFTDLNGNEEMDSIVMSLDVVFNGTASQGGGEVIFSRNATPTQKQAAVRAKVNELLRVGEEGAANLNNANIQIVGLPV